MGKKIYFDMGSSKTIESSPSIKVGADVWFPKGGYKYYDKALRRTFYSRDEKAKYLKDKKLTTYEDGISERVRYNRLADEINYDREKRGMKPKTVAQLRGDK